MNISNRLILCTVTLFLAGCAGLEKSESKKLRKANLIVEKIHPPESEPFFKNPTLKLASKRELYPWESKYIGAHPRITKEFFQCKGNPLSPFLSTKSTGKETTYRVDCNGGARHSLPIRNGKEFIYPVLIDILNHVQETTGKRVTITSGYRCPIHNIYVDPSKKNRISRHLIGAAVDFYVEGMELCPLDVIAVLQSFYEKNPPSLKSESTWSNRELSIKLFQADEGRNLDNNHDYPYISLTVKYDRKAKKLVPFSWKEAYNSFHRN